jgi:hypothetical protein
MDWGDRNVLPPDTDGGTVERDEVAVTYLTGITADLGEDGSSTAAALEALLGR